MSRIIDNIWEDIFDDKRILDRLKTDEIVEITSAEINKFRESRLMTKMDNSSQLPEIFKNNQLGILPISRGSYVIGKFNLFADFNTNIPQLEYVDFPTHIESIDYTNITSESTALNCAFVSKILQDFTKEPDLIPTVNGRMGSSKFQFNIDSITETVPISVNNSQIEIDGGYEGLESLMLIEAKNYLSDDFIIRQLYYPYRLWKNKVTKKVRPVYVVYSNGIYHLREYQFTNDDVYNSITLIQEKRYAIRREQEINIELIKKIILSSSNTNEPLVPFPQADSFERVINLCEILNDNEVSSKDELTTNFGFDSRQTDYYANAAKYLGLINNAVPTELKLTSNGKRIFELTLQERQIEFIRLIMSHKVFREVLNKSFDNGNIITRYEIVEIMKESNLRNIDSDSTYKRRASTISSWIKWILLQIDE